MLVQVAGARVRNNDEKEKEANNEHGFTCGNERDNRGNDDDDSTFYGRPKGSTKAMSRDYEQRIAQANLQYRNCEDARNGTNLEELACQRKEKALWAIASNERYTAGRHVVAGRLVPKVVDDQPALRGIQKKKCRVSKRIRKLLHKRHLQTSFMQSERKTNRWQRGQRRKRKQWQQASRRSSIANNKATSTYQIP